MNATKFLKKRLPTVPFAVGSLIAKLPYSRRPFIGRLYEARRREIAAFPGLSLDEKHNFIFERIRAVVNHAYKRVPFYQNFYQLRDFHPSCLVDFDSIGSVPIVKKEDLVRYSIEDRSAPDDGNRISANTGGSTGRPLSFYIQTDSYGHEKSHMDSIWESLGYSHVEATLTFSGRSQLRKPIQYDGLRHAFLVDIYKPFEIIAEQISELIRNRRLPRFLHGYPSAIHDFLQQANLNRPEIARSIRENTLGVFLGSEFPSPRRRGEIEELTQAPSISWYGHTERCVLAAESGEKYKYIPYQTYGFSEAVGEFGDELLTGTSYYNFASPMIRYCTGDRIQTLESSGGILCAFSVTDGRSGEFVVDRSGKNIPLTGLIYGRHHRLFDFCRSIQVQQDSPGKVTVFYSCSNGRTVPGSPVEHFDTSNVEIDFNFVECSEPVRTSSGKVGLLVHQ